MIGEQGMFDVCIIGHMCIDLMVKPLEALPPGNWFSWTISTFLPEAAD
jgi:hypothetical protein